MERIKKQVKKVIDESTARGKEVAKKVRETVDATKKAGEALAKQFQPTMDATKKASEALNAILSKASPADLLNKFGTLSFSDLLEKLRSSELSKHSEAIRQEVLHFLRLSSLEALERLEVSVEKLTREVASLKALRTEVQSLATEVKALKGEAKKTEKVTKKTAQ
jgi:prefoldin subunit 5